MYVCMYKIGSPAFILPLHTSYTAVHHPLIEIENRLKVENAITFDVLLTRLLICSALLRILECKQCHCTHAQIEFTHYCRQQLPGGKT